MPNAATNILRLLAHGASAGREIASASGGSGSYSREAYCAWKSSAFHAREDVNRLAIEDF
jgi:hypothetical protein